MNLEIISKRSEQGSLKPPIVLVHGAWHGAWCWESNFLDYFPENGWDTLAFSFRGHGLSDGAENLRWSTINDYVADLTQVITALDRPPILIGHSMGGFVVQKYLETHNAAGAVLLASIPPSGTYHYNLRFLRSYPMLWLRALFFGSLYPLVGTPDLVREWFFSSALSNERLLQHYVRFQDESLRAALDMLFLNLIKPNKISTPLAVLGGDRDRILSAEELYGTALAYRVRAKIFPNRAHDLMLQAEWQKVADWILSWISLLPAAIEQSHEAMPQSQLG